MDRGRKQELSASYRYAAGRPVAFVDESLRLNPRLGTPFYTMTGVLIERSQLDTVRRELQRVGRSPGGRTWHTTDAYEQGRHEQIERMVQLVAERTEWSIVTVDAPVKSEGLQGQRRARADCFRALVPELTRGPDPCRVIIMDQRSEAGDKDDLRIAAELRGSDRRLQHLHVRHASDDEEPLLAAPDVAGWATRRLLTVDETRWVEPARDSMSVVHAGSGQRFEVDELVRWADEREPEPARDVEKEEPSLSTLDRLVERAQRRPSEEPPPASGPGREPPRPEI